MNTHYQLTYEERRAVGGYVARSDDAAQPEMICRTGDGHAVGTRDWDSVTCPACLERRRLPPDAGRDGETYSVEG